MVYSYLSSKVVERKSSIAGRGCFALEKINKGEIVFVKGGYILTRNTMLIEKIADNYWPISGDLFLAPKKDSSREEVQRIKLYINHSCNPNCGIRGEITGIAMRDIGVSEEITFDYAMLDDEEDDGYNFECDCSRDSLNCRKLITGKDWLRPELQKKYDGYFALYLQEKIDNIHLMQIDM